MCSSHNFSLVYYQKIVHKIQKNNTMDSITIGWNKHSSDEVQFLTNRQYFQQDSTENIINQDKKFNKKKVHFNCNTPDFKQQAFENTEQNHLKTNGTPRLSFEDHNYISSSTKIFTFQ